MFGYFLMLVAASVAGVAAYFSVYGIAHIFAAAMWSAVIMGGALEVGKLVATSYLYRYWSVTNWALRVYLLAALMVLMSLTSIGIFGYLSNAYQQDSMEHKSTATRVELLDKELMVLEDRQREINADVNRVGADFVRARQNLLQQYAPEREQLLTRIASIRQERLQLSADVVRIEAHLGPIVYIAKAIDRDVDTAVTWLILLIIFAFDPLAIALTVAANVVLTSRTSHSTDVPMSQELPEPERNIDSARDYPQEERDYLESQIKYLANMSEALVAGNETLEAELVCMSEELKRKDAVIDQLREAVTQLSTPPIEEPTQSSVSAPVMDIRERAALHEQNQLKTKQ